MAFVLTSGFCFYVVIWFLQVGERTLTLFAERLDRPLHGRARALGALAGERVVRVLPVEGAVGDRALDVAIDVVVEVAELLERPDDVGTILRAARTDDHAVKKERSILKVKH